MSRTLPKPTLLFAGSALLVIWHALSSSGQAKDLRPYQVAALKEMLAVTTQSQKADDELILQIDTVADGLEKYFRKRPSKRRMPLSDYDTQVLKQELVRLISSNPYQTNATLNPSATQPGGTTTSSAPQLNGRAGDAQSAATNIGSTTTFSSATPDKMNSSGIPSLPANLIASSAMVSTSPSAALPGPDTKSPTNTSSPFVDATKNDDQSSRFSKDRLVISCDPAITASNAKALRTKMPDTYKDLAGTIHVVFNEQDTAFIWGADFSGRPVFDRTKKRFKLVALTLQSY